MNIFQRIISWAYFKFAFKKDEPKSIKPDITINFAYQFELFNHLEPGMGADFYRIVVQAESEERAIKKAREEGNRIAIKWIEEYRKETDLLNPVPFRLYKIVGQVDGYVLKAETNVL